MILPPRRDSGRWRLVRRRRLALPGTLRRAARRLATAARRAGRRRLVVAGSGVALVAACLALLLFASPVLGVRRVEVSGARIAAAEQVRSAAGVAMGTPLARVDTGSVARRVAALAPVLRVRVSRSWPDTLVIAIVERTGFAVVARSSGFLVLDHSGVVFDTVAVPDDLPVLRLVAPGPHDPATAAAVSVLDALSPQLRAALKELVADSPLRLRLELTDGRSVVWGDGLDSALKSQVATALLTQPGTVIDVSVPGVATVTP